MEFVVFSQGVIFGHPIHHVHLRQLEDICLPTAQHHSFVTERNPEQAYSNRDLLLRLSGVGYHLQQQPRRQVSHMLRHHAPTFNAPNLLSCEVCSARFFALNPPYSSFFDAACTTSPVYATIPITCCSTPRLKNGWSLALRSPCSSSPPYIIWYVPPLLPQLPPHSPRRLLLRGFFF